MQATGREVPTQTEPEEEAGAQRIILEEVTHEDPDTNLGEAADHPALDDPPGVEATGGVIKTRMTREPEYPGVTPPGMSTRVPGPPWSLWPTYLYHWRSIRTYRS